MCMAAEALGEFDCDCRVYAYSIIEIRKVEVLVVLLRSLIYVTQWTAEIEIFRI